MKFLPDKKNRIFDDSVLIVVFVVKSINVRAVKQRAKAQSFLLEAEEILNPFVSC